MFDYTLVIHEPSKVAVAALSNSLNSIFTAHGAYNDGVVSIDRGYSVDVKKSVFKKLDNICKADCVLASNTSSFSLSSIASSCKNSNKR